MKPVIVSDAFHIQNGLKHAFQLCFRICHQEGMELNVTSGENINTIKKNTEALLLAIKRGWSRSKH
jgi:hypothetical protein